MIYRIKEHPFTNTQLKPPRTQLHNKTTITDMWGKINLLPEYMNITAEKLGVNSSEVSVRKRGGWFCLKEKFLLCFLSPNSYFLHLHNAGSLSSHSSIFSNRTLQTSPNSTATLGHHWGLLCANSDEKAKCYFKMLPGRFWAFITKYLYFLNMTQKCCFFFFFGCCQAMI